MTKPRSRVLSRSSCSSSTSTTTSAFALSLAWMIFSAMRTLSAVARKCKRDRLAGGRLELRRLRLGDIRLLGALLQLLDRDVLGGGAMDVLKHRHGFPVLDGRELIRGIQLDCDLELGPRELRQTH